MLGPLDAGRAPGVGNTGAPVPADPSQLEGCVYEVKGSRERTLGARGRGCCILWESSLLN